MKKKGIKVAGIALLGLSILFTSCDEMFNDVGIVIDSDYITLDITIPPIPGTGYYEFAAEEFNLNLDSLLMEEGASINDIQSVKIKEVMFENMDEDPELNFNAFSLIEVSISTNETDKIKLAYQDTIPDDSKLVNCKKENADLTDYASAAGFFISVAGSNDEPITDTLNIEGRLKFQIQVAIANALSATE